MSTAQFAPGVEVFRELREEGYYYVDKTALISELLNNVAKVSLITRPRRFGKTLTMSMLGEFFDIEKDSSAIFTDLSIAHDTEMCSKWMNCYPVLSISLKGMTENSFDKVLYNLSGIIQEICIFKKYLLESDKVSSADKISLQAFTLRNITDYKLNGSITTVLRALYMHWGKPVIVLIDEYDVPLANAFQQGFYADMAAFMRNFLGDALKGNSTYKFAVLTGCLRISKESIFTGLNNFTSYGIETAQFADKFGFTAQEVDALLHAAQHEEKKASIKAWYDGYQFGNIQEIYCPWDIFEYLHELRTDPTLTPRAYWDNTSSNDIVKTFLRSSHFDVKGKWEQLIRGEAVSANIIESLTYEELFDSEDHLWTILYLTGYLTKARKKDAPNHPLKNAHQADALPSEEKSLLVIPNEEVRQIFIRSVDSWFRDLAFSSDRQQFFDALWAGRTEEVEEHLSAFLLQSVSYYDSHFEYCHGFMSGVFFKSGYGITSNDECGDGRPDLVIEDRKQRRVAIIEIKHTKKVEDFPVLARTALRQIQEKNYAAPFREHDGITILLWGIAFCKKSCRALFVHEQ